MAIDRWFLGGGAEHTPEAARRALYASTSGSEGVGGSKDLQVLPLAVPGQGVRVSIGSALMRSRFVGGETQTYMGTVYEQETVSITPTGSGSGRSDLIILRVEDPYAAGTPYTPPVEAERATAPYIYVRVVSGVPAGTTKVQDVPGHQNDTAVTLARIDLPASTGTVTTGIITDLRKVAQPQTLRKLELRFPTGAFAEGRRMSVGSYSDWPLVDGERPVVEVPEWASVIKIVATIEGAWFAKTGSETRNMVAGTLVGLGNQMNTQNGIVTKFASDAGERASHTFVGSVKIPESMRGTSQPIRLQANVTSAATTGSLFADYQSTVFVDYEFAEEI